jgi:hypothetical protein
LVPTFSCSSEAIWAERAARRLAWVDKGAERRGIEREEVERGQGTMKGAMVEGKDR